METIVYKQLSECVFPSVEPSIQVLLDDEYGGAHTYKFIGCLGFKDGKTQYDLLSVQQLQFVQKSEDGKVIPGVQSEQLVLALIDRHEKMNAKYPSSHHEKAMAGLKMFLDAQRERVVERMDRGIMGELKK